MINLIPELNIGRTWNHHTVGEHPLWNYNSIQGPILFHYRCPWPIIAVKTGKINTLKMKFVDEFQKIIAKRRKYVSTTGFGIIQLSSFTLRALAVKVTRSNLYF